MTDLYHGPYPVDMTVNEARAEVLRLQQSATPYIPPDTLARLQRERDQAVEALREITNPIAAMHQRAEDLGAKLDGAVAFQLANDVGYLQGIARATLAAIGAEDGIL